MHIKNLNRTHEDTLQTRVERAFRTRKIKQYIAILTLMLVMFTSLTICMPTASADCGADCCCQGTSWRTKRNELASIDGVGGFVASCWDFATTAGNCNPHFNFADIVKHVYKFASYDGVSMLEEAVGDFSGAGAGLIGAGRAMYEAMSVIGICLIFLFFLIDILDEVQADSFTIEHLIKKLLTLTVAIIIVNMGADIFDYICQMGDALIEDAADATKVGNEGALNKIYDVLKAAGNKDGLLSSVLAVVACVGVLVEHAVPYVLMLVAVVIAYLVGFGRLIEVLVRFAFAPIALAQLVSGGAKGPGMRYIKKFASTVFQGAVCVLAFGTVTIITNAASGLNAVLAMILVPITLIGFLMKAGRIADDICGV